MGRRAIDLALDLARMPALAGAMREQALPVDLLDVIRIAAGCPDASDAAFAATQKPVRALRAAAVLYLEEILFFPHADLYRNLGVANDAAKSQMRLHMRWLLQWLHPDHNSNETATLLATRVIHAWHELGRREGLGAGIERSAEQSRVARGSRSNESLRRSPVRVPWIAVPIASATRPRRRGARTMMFGLAGAAAALIFIAEAVLSGSLFSSSAKRPALAAAQGDGRAILVDVTHK